MGNNLKHNVPFASSWHGEDSHKLCMARVFCQYGIMIVTLGKTLLSWHCTFVL
jgi:hypothetical protein